MADGEQGRYLVIRHEGRNVAIPVAHVIETMRPLPLRAMARLPHGVAGVSIVRGDTVPVVDLPTLLGRPGAAPTRYVTVRAGDHTVALAVPGTLEVLGIAEDTWRTVPPLVSELRQELLDKIGVLDGELIAVIRTARILPETFWAELETAR